MLRPNQVASKFLHSTGCKKSPEESGRQKREYRKWKRLLTEDKNL
jgi:hypothetical protein